MNDTRILQRIDNHLRPKLKHRDRATRRFAATALRLAWKAYDENRFDAFLKAFAKLGE